MPICVKCGEETPHAYMSKKNPRMCKACWNDSDMGRFEEYQPEREEDEDE